MSASRSNVLLHNIKLHEIYNFKWKNDRHFYHFIIVSCTRKFRRKCVSCCRWIVDELCNCCCLCAYLCARLVSVLPFRVLYDAVEICKWLAKNKRKASHKQSTNSRHIICLFLSCVFLCHCFVCFMGLVAWNQMMMMMTADAADVYIGWLNIACYSFRLTLSYSCQFLVLFFSKNNC